MQSTSKNGDVLGLGKVWISGIVLAISCSAIAQNKPEGDLKILSSAQETEGATQADMDLNFLKGVETYTVERTKLKAKEYLAANGHPNAKINLASESNYIETGGKKLAILRIKDPHSFSVHIIGFVGKELRRVVCIRSMSDKSIPLGYGACSEEIQRVFGVKIGV